MFSSCPKDEDTNKGATDESKITRDRHSVSMTIQTSVMHSLRTLMIKSNGRSNRNE